jgi:hypothetical protein
MTMPSSSKTSLCRIISAFYGMLKLEAGRAPVDMLIIAHVERPI